MTFFTRLRKLYNHILVQLNVKPFLKISHSQNFKGEKKPLIFDTYRKFFGKQKQIATIHKENIFFCWFLQRLQTWCSETRSSLDEVDFSMSETWWPLQFLDKLCLNWKNEFRSNKWKVKMYFSIFYSLHSFCCTEKLFRLFFIVCLGESLLIIKRHTRGLLTVVYPGRSRTRAGGIEFQLWTIWPSWLLFWNMLDSQAELPLWLTFAKISFCLHTFWYKSVHLICMKKAYLSLEHPCR